MNQVRLKSSKGVKAPSSQTVRGVLAAGPRYKYHSMWTWFIVTSIHNYNDFREILHTTDPKFSASSVRYMCLCNYHAWKTLNIMHSSLSDNYVLHAAAAATSQQIAFIGGILDSVVFRRRGTLLRLRHHFQTKVCQTGVEYNFR